MSPGLSALPRHAPCPARPPKLLEQSPLSCTAHPRETRRRWGVDNLVAAPFPDERAERAEEGSENSLCRGLTAASGGRSGTRLEPVPRSPSTGQDDVREEHRPRVRERARDGARATDKSLRSQVRSIERGVTGQEKYAVNRDWNRTTVAKLARGRGEGRRRMKSAHSPLGDLWYLGRICYTLN